MPVERVEGVQLGEKGEQTDAEIEEEVRRGVLLTTLDRAVGWARKQSMWPATFGLACCAIEMMSTGAGYVRPVAVGDGAVPGLAAPGRPHDRRRPRVARRWAPVLRRIYDQMPEPKWVISMGVCASSGGMFTNYAVVQGVDTIVPVDIYVPGLSPAARDAHVRDPPAAGEGLQGGAVQVMRRASSPSACARASTTSSWRAAR